MLGDSVRKRMWLCSGLLVAATLLLHSLSHGERIVPHESLRELPMTLGDWEGEEIPLDKQVVEVAAVDDYVNRFYRNRTGLPLALYVGFYESQRTGDTIHSPKNCLPGAGWQPLEVSRLQIRLSGGPIIEVNQYLVEKGLDRQLVIYWYQGRGRVIASEYAGKWWMIVDAITRDRTDGALVRVSAPLQGGEEKTRARLENFIQALYPSLSKLIPD